MTDSTDELIDRTLAAVRDTELPVGMRQRIFANVEERAGRRQPSISDSLLAIWKGALVVTACAVCLCLYISQHSAQPHTKMSRTPPAEIATVGSIETQHDIAWQRLRVRGEEKPPRNSTLISHTVSKETAPAEPDDMHAPSKAAPDLPLTTQEKVLVQAVHRNNPVLLAELQPTDQAPLAAHRTDVQQFLKQLVAPMTSAEIPEQSTAKASDPTQVGSEEPSQQSSTTSATDNGEPQ